nr:ATP-binding protein [Alsobacter ponti]
MSFAMALAIGGGMLMSLGFLRRVEAINRTTANIVAGNLSERIPITGSFDELDTLAENLNAMLARIQTLMDGLRQVSTDIAHDLRTPLARLRQRLEAARDRVSGENGDVSEYEAALEEIDAILATFSALLRIAQIESGARLQGFRRVNLSAVFATVAEAYAPAAEDKGQTLTSAIEAGIDISGDRELLTQMLANLLENALHHAPQGASIRVTLTEHGRLAVGEVSDDGPGIPEAERANVLRRFYRLERSRGAPGNGLGLSLVAAVAELHHVDLSLEDNRPGLRVVMTFPEARHAAESAPAARTDRATPLAAAAAEPIPRP